MDPTHSQPPDDPGPSGYPGPGSSSGTFLSGTSIFGGASTSGEGNATPHRFATSTNAFGLTISPSASSSSSAFSGGAPPPQFATGEISPTIPGGKKARLRRPSMLSLAQTPVVDLDPSGSPPPFAGSSGHANALLAGDRDDIERTGTGLRPPALTPSPNPFLQALHPAPTPKWTSSFLLSGGTQMGRNSSGPSLPFEGLSTSTPPIPSTGSIDHHGSPSGLAWRPSPRPSVSAVGDGDDVDIAGPAPGPSRPPFTGKPLPAPLLATLISESAPAEHEMRSEARLQRLLASHPARFPYTPRPPRGSRGRFPEMVGGDDDDDDDDILMSSTRRTSAAWNPRGWFPRAASSDSDEDDIMDESGEGVQSAFAAGMDLERPSSSGSMSVAPSWGGAGTGEGSGKSTPGHQSTVAPKNGGPSGGDGSVNGSGGGNSIQPTPPLGGQAWSERFKASRLSFSSASMGLIPSPSGGGGLPGAFGSLGMGNITPLTSPTVEKLELATSPSAVSVASPSLMQYRDSSASTSYRPGKRKAAAEDRYDPYKRPRGVSPALSNAGSVASMMSPSRNSPAIPIPSSPSHTPMYYPSTLSSSNPMRSRAHYTRPMASRSRQASPALSIGSASGVLSTSLGAGAGASTHRGSFAVAAPLGGTFVPTGNGGAKPQGPDLGGLGLLSLQGASGVGETVEEEEGDEVELADGNTPTEVSSGMSRQTSRRSASGPQGEGEGDVEGDRDGDVEGMEMEMDDD